MTFDASYRIRGDNPADWVSEANRIFELIVDRLDSIQGLRGHYKVYNYVESSSDVAVVDSTKGLVLKDDGDPPNYWRVTVNSTGTLVVTEIGRTYP